MNKLDEELLYRFTSIVEDNLTMDIDTQFVQDRLNMSHSSIYRKIKSLTGLSGNEFVRKICLKHGRSLLMDCYNVTEATCSCGFGYMKHFRNSFKDEYSVTASQFIKDLKTKRKVD